jgi:hypothetical protein
MENYKRYTWRAKMFGGLPFQVSFIATTEEAARKGILDQLHEITKAVFRDNIYDVNPNFMDPVHTDFISNEPLLDISSFTEDTRLDSGELLGSYITRTEPYVYPFNLAWILVDF